jgi:phosphoserine aminotransferase
MPTYNFSAGPAMLPADVMRRAQIDMRDFQNSGMSVMEMSHRGSHFLDIAACAEQDLRDLLGVPENYKVLFLQGGASTQFAAVPMNLLRGKTSADYLNTGAWSKKAIAEAGRYLTVNEVCSGKSSNFSHVPAVSDWQLNDQAAYVHYTPNETIGGVEFSSIPDVGDVPLVADMSSTILSRPLDVTKFGVIYAGAQKNIGPAGLTLVIVRDDLLGDVLPNTPSMLDYAGLAKAESMLNTPPTYSWYLAGLVFDWLKQQGGLEAMATTNQQKAQKLYDAIDGSSLYSNPVQVDCRSWMNVPFILADAELDKSFLQQAGEQNLLSLKGHRSVGGMRASIYNAMPVDGIDALIGFMQEFERKA